MAYAPKPGCPLCGIVSSASHATPNSPLSPSFPPGSTQPEVLWRDDNFTAYREKAHPLSSKGHIIIAFKFVFLSFLRSFTYWYPACMSRRYTLLCVVYFFCHCWLFTSLQSSSDLPLLVNIRNLATRLLTSLVPSSSPAVTPSSLPNSTYPSSNPLPSNTAQFRIGFITPPFKDNQIPVTDHLHAHAYIVPADLMGWWRGIAYGPLAWYAIDDLIAEIR